MRRLAALLLAVLPCALRTYAYGVSLSVSPQSIVLTEKAEATIVIEVPASLPGTPTVDADFIPKGFRPQASREQAVRDGKRLLRYTIRIPVSGDAAGTRTLGPVSVSVPTRTDFFGFVSKAERLTSPTVELEVVAPPEEGRPVTYCGAIASRFHASAALDTNVCTAGDPLLFTLEISGANDASMVFAPDMSAVFRGTPFRLDRASLKTETLAASKRFTWRVRALGAGTVEFPSVKVSWFDAGSRAYRTVDTERIPVQVKAGAQAALGAMDEIGGETDEFPMPDGIDLPFEPQNFTLRHAISLAMRAVEEGDFASAAERYSDFVRQMRDNPSVAAAPDGGAFEAVHLRNLGALLVMGGKPREAIGAFEASELAAGGTPETLHGLRAAYARMKNDPRADLPVQRILFPFWYRCSLAWRVLMATAAAVALLLLFILAVRSGRRLAALALLCGVPAAAQAWPFGGRNPFEGLFDDMPGMRMRMGSDACPVSAEVFFARGATSVGEGVDMVVRVNPGTVRIEGGGVGVEASLPELSRHGPLTSQSPYEYRMNATFLEPGTNDIRVVVSGAYSGTYTITNENSISSGRVINQPFRLSPPPARIVVRPLPDSGRPLDFTGAVGSRFRLSQKLVPDKVHPGDLVAAEYRLKFEGYCPSNATVRVENLSREFKAYDLKEVSRGEGEVLWRQLIVPRTTEATNSALVSFSYFDPTRKCYSTAVAKPARLTFVSERMASTENTMVSVTDGQVSGGEAADAASAVVLRFAPSATSPVVATLPAGTEAKETCRRNGWRRLATPRASGWTR